MAEVDLGAYIPKEANDPAATGGTWGEFIRANRPFLAGMGAQLLVGSPGGIGANLGAAIAKGNESQNMTEEMNYNRGVEERKFQAGQEEGEKNRASHEKIAGIAADSRSEVANIRSEAMLERARMIHGPQNDKEMQIYAKARSDYFKKEKDNQLISKKGDQQINMEADAWAKEQLRGAREAVGVRSQGAPLPTDAPSGLGMAETQVGAPSPTPGQPGASAKGAPTPNLDQMLADPRYGPQLKQDLSSQEGIARILANPKLEPKVRQEIMQRYGYIKPGADEYDPPFNETAIGRGLTGASEYLYDKFGSGYKPTIQKKLKNGG